MSTRADCPTVALIAGGRVIDPASGFDGIADVVLDGNGMIERLVPGGARGGDHDHDGLVLDARGLIVSPGFVDLHTHLREPGREDEETVASGSAAGVRGGFTTLCCMPNTEPPIADQETVRFVLDRALGALGRVFPIGSITRNREGKSLAEIAEMVAAGAVAFSDDGAPVASAGLLRRAMQYAHMFDAAIVEHCEIPDLSGNGVMHEGLVSTKLGLRGIPAISEEICVARDIALARETGAHLHVAHVSTAGSVAIIRRAKAEGVRVTAEATPHHLILTDEVIAREFDPVYKVNPPLRTRDDVEALRAGVADGTIDCIASDHAPHAEQEKDGEFDLAASGMIGLETTLGVAVKALVETGLIDWPRLLGCLTFRAARVFDLPVGVLQAGASADIVLLDPDARWVVTPEKITSKSRNCPYFGWELTGVVRATVVAGRLVHRGDAAADTRPTETPGRRSRPAAPARG